MDWIWSLWATALVLMLATATAMERSMLKNKIDGANGLILFVSMVMAGAGSLAVFIITWVMREGRTALVVGAVEVLALWAGFKLAIWLVERVEARRK